MKFSTTKEHLETGLQSIGRIPSKNLSLPILGNILIKVEEAQVHLISTNLEIAIQTSIRAKVEEIGEYTLPAKLLQDYVHLLPMEKIDIHLTNNALEIQCGKFHTLMKGIEASDFPIIPQITNSVQFSSKSGMLARALQNVVFSVSPNESRVEISGVLFAFNHASNPGMITLAATDSYRLSEVMLHLQGEESEKELSKNIIIPSKTINELIRILSFHPNDDVVILCSDNQVLFRVDQTQLISRLIDGQYPEYRLIIPQQFATNVTLLREELIRAVKASNLFSRTGINDVKLIFDSSLKTISVSSANNQTGENSVLLEAKTFQGKQNHLVLNARYLLDGLEHMNTEAVHFELNDDANPSMIRPNDINDALYIVMPIKQ